ncbi:hypothetical protein NEIG_01759 [Nematocida sp. ERTm5]|nr:hypothetical protein NEIG_01759 [Nematocida sp. ERTm5]
MHFCITGGSHGLGKSLSIHLLLNNHKVTIIDKDTPSVKCTYIHHDFTEYLTIPVHCDVLVINHATFNGFIPFSNNTQEYVDDYLMINLLSHIHLIKHCKYSKLVHINSVLSIVSFPNVSLYSASKGFMHSFIESIRREGVPVLSVYPYKINTSLFKDVHSPYVLDKDKISKSIYTSIIHNHTHLYLPRIFKYSYIYTVLPFFIQNWIISLLYYAMCNNTTRA